MILLLTLISSVFFSLQQGRYPPQPPTNLAKIIFLYRMTSRPDSTNKATTDELTQLAVTDSMSEFRSVNRYKPDSLFAQYAETSINSPGVLSAMGRVMSLPKYKFDAIVIKTKGPSKCHYYSQITGVPYVYEDVDYPCRWTILTDTMTVNGYKCQKASTQLGGRSYVAWFTRKIAISDGPYKFSGLPGLVVSVYDTTNSYKFELINVSIPNRQYFVLNPNEIWIPKAKVVSISKVQYYDTYYRAMTNAIDNALAKGSTFNNEQQVRRNYQEKVKHRNNPIELAYKKF